MAIVQWVNLEKNSDFLDDPDIVSLDRCGALEVKNAFAKKNIPLSYKVKVSPAGTDNIEYNTAEAGRNDNFKLMKGATDLGTEAEVLMSDTIRLPAAGGNKYKLQAKDANGVEVESQEIEAKRKLYYQYMHMEDANGKVTKSSLSQLEAHCLKNFAVLSKAGSDKKLPFRKCINMDDGTAYSWIDFYYEVSQAHDISAAKKKIGCAAVLSNYIGSYEQQSVSISESVAKPTNPMVSMSLLPSVSPVTGNGGTVSLTVLGVDDFLWYGLDDDDDHPNKKTWFIDGAISFIPDPNISGPDALAGHSIPIDRADVSIGGSKQRTYGGHNVIDIKVGPALGAMLSQADGTVIFALNVNKVAGFTGGFSTGATDGSESLITACTKAWFEAETATGTVYTWNHEVGHRMGMVAYGDKVSAGAEHKQPDAPPNVYGENPGVNDKGHQGPHCEKNVVYNPSNARNPWTGVPGCVMFGATGTQQSDSPPDYCSDCEPVVRKLDLSFPR